MKLLINLPVRNLWLKDQFLNFKFFNQPWSVEKASFFTEIVGLVNFFVRLTFTLQTLHL